MQKRKMKKLHWLDELEKDSRKALFGVERKTDPASWGTDTHSPHQFFFELIANADDEGATKAKLIVDDNKIIFQHNGKEFSKEDVDNITSYKKRKKHNKLDKIGNFGSGFKTIHQICKEPEIYTLIDNELICFKIEKKIIPCRKKISKINETKIINEFKKDGATKFVFQFNNKKNSYKQLLDVKSFNKFLHKNEELLLFLPNIKEIKFKIENSSFSFKKETNKIDENLFKVSLLNRSKYKKYFYLYSQKFSLPGYEKNNKATVSVAYKYSRNKNNFLPVNNDKNLFVFFNMQENFEYKFYINAPFRTTESRVSILEENKDNEILSKHCEEVILNSILKFKKNKILNISFFDLLPLEKDKINNFVNIKDKINSFLREEEIWPTSKGKEFCSINNIIFGELEYKKVFSNEDLVNFEIRKKWVDNPKTKRTKDLLKYLEVNEFNSYNFEAYLDWNLILNNKSDKKLFSIYLLLNLKLDSSTLESLPVVKSRNGNFRKGPHLRFPSNNNSQQLNIEFVDKNFLDNNKYQKLKEFFIKCGVTEINPSDVIKTNISKIGLDFNTKINVNIKEYENLINEIIASKLEFNANTFPYLIDENLTCRRGDELYVDDKVYSTKLGAIYKGFPELGINKYKIYFPEKIDSSIYLSFLEKLNVQKELKVKEQYEFKNKEIRRKHYNLYDPPTGRSINEEIDYWLNDLENIIINMTMEKSLFISKKLNEAIEEYYDISKSMYKRTKNSRPRYMDSSLILFLKRNEWIPDKNGKFRLPKDLSEDTIDKNIYETINSKCLEWFDFNQKDIVKDEDKKTFKKYGFDEWAIDHPEAAAEAINEAKARYELENSDELKRKKFGKSHRKVLDDDMEMEDNFDDKNFVKKINITNNTHRKNYKEEEKQSVRSKYSYHCQMCHVESYKTNSYSEHTENRRKISEDAHIVKDSDGGPAIYGNLLSLCVYHHHFHGDEITPNMVLESIKLDGSKWEDGIIHKIKLLDGDTIDIYFKEEHKTKIIRYLSEYENQKVVNFSPNKK